MFPQQAFSVPMLNESPLPENKATLQRHSSAASGHINKLQSHGASLLSLPVSTSSSSLNPLPHAFTVMLVMFLCFSGELRLS